jgi:hypothetical protein
MVTQQKGRFTANPAAVAYDWTDTYEGDDHEYRHELAWIRGTNHISYGTSVDGRPWVNTMVRSPERFGDFDGTEKGFRRFVTAFLTDDETAIR